MLVYQRVMFSAEVYGVNPVMDARHWARINKTEHPNWSKSRSCHKSTSIPVPPVYICPVFVWKLVHIHKLNLPDNSVLLGIIAVNLISTPCPIYHRSHFSCFFSTWITPGSSSQWLWTATNRVDQAADRTVVNPISHPQNHHFYGINMH